MNFKSAKKVIFGELIVIAGILGIKFADLDWWTGFIVAVVQGSVIYWTRNDPGTLTSKANYLRTPESQ